MHPDELYAACFSLQEKHRNDCYKIGNIDDVRKAMDSICDGIETVSDERPSFSAVVSYIGLDKLQFNAFEVASLYRILKASGVIKD